MGPDDVRAGKAGLAVWDVAPERYWTFHEYVMANQPSAGKEWATTNWLTTAAENVGVEDVDAVRSRIESDRYEDLLQQTVQDAQDAGYNSTPTLAVDGRSLSPYDGDSLPQSTRNALDELTGR
jgi:protein-disulfide isomerase